MAKIILSALVDDIRGKLGGSVFQTTVGGLQLRTRVSPRDPKTGSQQRSRGSFSYLTRQWNNLTPAQIATWNDNAPVDTTGISFFIFTNQKIALTGQPAINSYTGSGSFDPLLLTLEDLDPTVFVISTPGLGAVLPANVYLNVFVTIQLSNGTTFISPSAYVYLMSMPPASDPAAPFTIYADYIARNGVPITGRVIGISAYLINVSTGLVGTTAFIQDNVA